MDIELDFLDLTGLNTFKLSESLLKFCTCEFFVNFDPLVSSSSSSFSDVRKYITSTSDKINESENVNLKTNGKCFSITVFEKNDFVVGAIN
ncbi:hypothetical protein WICPIJ_002649 [Wickerhamomyces pijperi]|uniref:Uncharacterized protein n=1 Tax=Wickerhamomyces pijperi TaxID=599730 RepID=A0A9P8TPL9_WICPI|nr:hypothetical protein WICPIJ_002649 [Wickerhamomyces pijperi]